MFQWSSVKCQYQIGWEISAQFLHNDFYIEAVNLSERHSVAWNTVLLQWLLPNAGPLIGRELYVPIIFTTTCITSISEVWSHPSDHQIWLTYHHAPVSFYQILSSNWLTDFCHFRKALSHTRHGTLLHWMPVILEYFLNTDSTAFKTTPLTLKGYLHRELWFCGDAVTKLAYLNIY